MHQTYPAMCQTLEMLDFCVVHEQRGWEPVSNAASVMN